MRSSCAARDTRWSSPSDDSFATIIQLTFPYTSQGAFCGVCSADSNGTSYHRSVGRCEPCEGSILPAIVSAVMALAVLLALLAFCFVSTYSLFDKISIRVVVFLLDMSENGDVWGKRWFRGGVFQGMERLTFPSTSSCMKISTRAEHISNTQVSGTSHVPTPRVHLIRESEPSGCLSMADPRASVSMTHTPLFTADRQLLLLFCSRS